MSGRKQHFIPQSLLKGFGVPRGKMTHVVAYTHDRGIFTAATDGIGAERNFYSELDVEGATETLDDRITDYEQPFVDILATLRGMPDGGVADTSMAATFVTHLAVRNDHFRKAIAAGSQTLLQGMAGALDDPVAAQTMLGLAGDTPSALFAGELATMLERYKDELATLGLPKAELEALIFQLVKRQFPTFFAGLSGPLAATFATMIGQLPDVAANAQKKSLDQELSPPIRVERLSLLTWRVRHPETALVLPDCVSIGLDENGAAYPHMLADLDRTAHIVMPLSTDRLLVGSRADTAPQIANFNPVFAACSWDFYVARDRHPAGEEWRGMLRTRASQILDETVEEVLGDAVRAGAAP